MSNRAPLGLGDDNDIDLEDLIGGSQISPTITPELKKALDTEGAKHGFVSREPVIKKLRKRSPYVIQKNIKMRIGMPELLNDLTAAIKADSDQEALEIAISTLIEKEGLKDLKTRFMELTTK